MLKESTFVWALSLSVLGHASLFILSPSHVGPAEFLKPKTEDVAITYFEIREAPQWGGVAQKEFQPPKASEGIKQPASVPPPSPAVVRLPDFLRVPKPKLVERAGGGQTIEKKEGALKAEVLYQEMASNLKDPVFVTYYQAIREKIRKAAKRRYEGKPDEGDVSVGFTLFSNGRLKEASVLRESSRAGPNLCSIAVQSLVDASPFPPFPEPLRREQLSFLVVLTFEPKP